MSKMKHTPEPWRLTEKSMGVCPIEIEDFKNQTIALFGNDESVAEFVLKNYEANAARIVDCVNACAEMGKPTVEIPAMKAEIAALRARVAEFEKDKQSQADKTEMFKSSWNPPKPKPTEQPTTVEGWLKLLPDGYRERALGQMDQEGKGRYCYSTSYALRRFTQWTTTNEGIYFWGAVYQHYAYGTPLPELPNN